MDYFILLGAVAPVFVIIAAGYILRRICWLTPEADQSLLKVGINFLYPCLIADTILGNQILEQLRNVVIPPLVGFGTTVLGFLACLVVGKLLRLEPRTAGSFAFTTGLYNYGYLPIPIVQAVYSRDVLGVLFTHNLGVEIALWTIGVWILSGTSGRDAWKKIFNVPIIAITLSVALNFAGAKAWLPEFVRRAILWLGQSAIPLALLLTGATLADLISRERSGTKFLTVAAANVLRLGLLPLVFLLIAREFPLSPALRKIVIIQAAMPSAMIPIVLARHYQSDSAAALQIVLSTTCLGLLTIPLWLKFGSWWVGAAL